MRIFSNIFTKTGMILSKPLAPLKKKSPNVLVKGTIARFAAVVPLYVGANAENAYAMLLEGQKEIILFQHAIMDKHHCAQVALLQPGDIVEFEVDHNGIGQIFTLRSSAFSANWKTSSGSVERAQIQEDIKKLKEDLGVLDSPMSSAE